jgi:outer membrane receptor protein involved in Fe transport
LGITPVQRLILCFASWCLFAVSLPGPASAAVLSGDIAPQPLPEALTAFAEQTGLQLFYLTATAETQQSRGAHAGTSPSAALTQLLEGTGLQFTFINARAVRIFAPPADTASLGHDPRSAPAKFPSSRHEARPAVLEEVLVTATRREERVNNVPMSIAVWTQEAMEASGIKGMTEIAALTPGVEFGFDPGFGDFFTSVAIRGVTDMHATVIGIFLDDTPIPPARGDSLFRSFPFSFDLDRVEVLRGPQGTLLGQRTLGGAVRFIPNQPSLTTFTGLARTELASTARGDASYEAGAATGGPMIPNVLGFRVSGWYRSDGGYVDRVDPSTGVTLDDNTNRSVNKSVRGALTWAPTDSLRITPSLTYQSLGIRDPSSFDTYLSNPEAGDLRHGNHLQRPFGEAFHLAALNLTAGIGTMDLSTVTSYFHRTAAALFDYEGNQADLTQTVFSHEARLTSADPTAALSWVAGVCYSSARNRETSRTAPGQDDIHVAGMTDETQLEAFGQIAFRMKERLTASAGLRIGSSKYIGRSKYDAGTGVPPTLRAEVAETSLAPRFELSYEPGERNLFYLTVAKGYGSGGIYLPVAGWQEGPEPYSPDALWSYEIGAKNGLFDGRVDLDTSVFHILWNNRPSDDTSAAAHIGVPGVAASNGFNVAARALLTERVKVGLALAYTDAHYTQTARVHGAVAIRKGDAVGGGVSPWNVTASIEHDFAVARGGTASVRAEDVFHSQNPGPFYRDRPGSPYYGPARPDPSTNVLNLRANVRWSSFDVALFVKNALDSQPTMMRTSFGDATTFRPRTIGLTATWRF